MSSTETVLGSLAFLAQVRAAFSKVHLLAERCPVLGPVTTEVIPFMGRHSDFADQGVTISVALSADVRRPADREKGARRIDLGLRHAGSQRIVEAQVGWSGASGWEHFDEREASAVSIDQIINLTPALVEWLGTRLVEEIAKLRR